MTRGKRVKAERRATFDARYARWNAQNEERAKWTAQNGPSRRPMERDFTPGPSPEFLTFLQQVAYARLDHEKMYPDLHLPTSPGFIYPADMPTWRKVFDETVERAFAPWQPGGDILPQGLINIAAVCLRWVEDLHAESTAARAEEANR